MYVYAAEAKKRRIRESNVNEPPCSVLDSLRTRNQVHTRAHVTYEPDRVSGGSALGDEAP